jgi:ribose/xylose/arabinose/galactoside ABC-type transport system permease subunit
MGLSIVSGILSDKFFTLRNWLNILNNFSVPGIVSCGVALVLLAGGIDLSFGSILACCAVFAAYLQPQSFILAITLPVFLGVLLGFINGLMISQIGTNPLITTLGTQWGYFALLMIMTGGNLVQGNNQGLFHFIGNGKIFNIPFPIFMFVAVGIFTWFLSRKTLFGKYLYAHGSNKNALFCSGVKASSVYLKTFIIMGLIIGIGGVVMSSRMIGVRPTEGGRYLINVLTAVILGGVSLNGGIGSVLNVIVAVLVLGVIDNSMVLLGVAYKDQQIIRGSVFIVSIIYNNYLIYCSEIFRRKCSTLPDQ